MQPDASCGPASCRDGCYDARRVRREWLGRADGDSAEGSALFDWESLREGLLVTGAGMGVVFAVLVLLQITIRGLSAFDRAPVPAEAASLPAAPAGPPAAAEGATPAEPRVAGEGAAPEVAAAIGVALALAEEEARSRGGGVSTPGGVPAPGWVQAGRGRTMSVRQREGRERGGR